MNLHEAEGAAAVQRPLAMALCEDLQELLGLGQRVRAGERQVEQRRQGPGRPLDSDRGAVFVLAAAAPTPTAAPAREGIDHGAAWDIRVEAAHAREGAWGGRAMQTPVMN